MANFPQLQVILGAYIAMKYLKNGYVTLLQNQLGKPRAAGIVFIFKTTQLSDYKILMDVLQWMVDSTSGN